MKGHRGGKASKGGIHSKAGKVARSNMEDERESSSKRFETRKGARGFCSFHRKRAKIFDHGQWGGGKEKRTRMVRSSEAKHFVIVIMGQGKETV